MSNRDRAIALCANECGRIRETVLSELDATRDRLARAESLSRAVPEGAKRAALLARLEAEQHNVAPLTAPPSVC
ncbi:hypothetical protein AB4851_11995 [Burkholderia sp. 22PA0099]|uniref:hypothetical protein n=1 Tax=Burkholderia sp. 22PA0099 TaxID=3237372 RepID=UPI0039C1C0B3